MRIVDAIERKRAGGENSREEIEHLVIGHLRGEVPDYQMSAWLMAVCCRGMSRLETFDLTSVMVSSGARLDLTGVQSPVVDKHSSGGVGDKTTLVVAPLARACGVAVAKMSGRGLGLTGGTLDKLESIPGFRVDLTAAEFVGQVERLGIVISGQTPELVPADSRLYALRDVTATVASIPLIASSIMSKKLAVGARGLVLDVKVGTGAFMATIEEARELAKLMVEIGTEAGRRVCALLTPMDRPLGMAVGNALEVAEAIRALRGEGPDDLAALSIDLVGEMLFLAGVAGTPTEGEARARRTLASGQGLEWLGRLLEAQGGDPRVVDQPELMGRSPVVRVVPAPRSGWVSRMDARGIAGAALAVGAGRARKGDGIDRRVGVVLRTTVGTEMREGDPLAEVHALDEPAAARGIRAVLDACAIEDERPVVVAEPVERYGPPWGACRSEEPISGTREARSGRTAGHWQGGDSRGRRAGP